MNALTGKSSFRLSDQELFYLEQWGAFLIGLTCLAIAAWAAAHDYRAAFSPHRSGVREGARLAFSWLLTIAVALIGTALTRFGFKAKHRNRVDEASLPPARYSAKPRTKESSGSNSLFVSREGNR